VATPLGHSIVGYTLARIAGVRSARGVAVSIAAASLPDIDFLLGYVSSGDARSLHREVITHRPAFPLIVGAVVALASLARGRGLGGLLRPAALATALVGSHIIMDPLPLPYDDMPPRTRSPWDAAAAHGWNGVVDLAVYGTGAVMVLGWLGSRGKPAAEA
jgi:hypothetical protein